MAKNCQHTETEIERNMGLTHFPHTSLGINEDDVHIFFHMRPKLKNLKTLKISRKSAIRVSIYFVLCMLAYVKARVQIR